MLTPLRLAPVRFTHLASILCFLAVGSFDTLKAQSTLNPSPTSLVFTAAQGANPNPVSQTINVMSTGANLIYTISLSPSGSWLSASVPNGFGGSPSGTTPDQVTVQINSASLPSGNYSGTITLTTNGGASVPILVSLTVSGTNATSLLQASPQQLTFGYEMGQKTPASQSVQISSSGVSLPILVGTPVFALSCPGNWLQAVLSTPAVTPAVLMLSINPAGLSANTCTANIMINSSTGPNGYTQVTLGITLYVTAAGSPVLNVTIPPGLQSVTLQQGQRVQFSDTNSPSPGNPISLQSSDPNIPVTFSVKPSVNSGVNWLTAVPTKTVTPADINVQITPGSATGGGLAVGSYTGTITITATGIVDPVTVIPITLNITSANSVSISNTSPGFTEQQGGSPPAPLTLTLTGPAAQSPSFTASVIPQTGGNWLQVSPASGGFLTPTPTSSSAPIMLTVLANTLSPDTYLSDVVINFANSATFPPITLTVSLTVQPPAAALSATPSAVSFSYQVGGSLPAAQTIAITNPQQTAPGSNIVTYNVSFSDSWLSISPTNGQTPGNLTVSVNPLILQPGAHNASFTLTPTTAGVAPTTVNVSLFISGNSAPQPFIISNAGSGVGGQLSPGEIITIKGFGLGPTTPVSFAVGSLTNPTLGGVQVTFNGISGTLLYVSSTQINVTVPYGIASSATAAIVVTYQGVQSSPISQAVAATSPGLFTDNSSGSGQAAILNQDFTLNGPPSGLTINGTKVPTTPAGAGSVISVYATGGGQTNPSSTDGEVSPTTSLLPLVLQQSVTATIGGKPATVTFAGAAPGYVTGVVQLNIQVPSGVTGSTLPILVTINGLQSQAGATIAVQ